MVELNFLLILRLFKLKLGAAAPLATPLYGPSEGRFHKDQQLGANIEIALLNLGARHKARSMPVKSFSKFRRKAQIGRKTVYEIDPESTQKIITLLARCCCCLKANLFPSICPLGANPPELFWSLPESCSFRSSPSDCISGERECQHLDGSF